MTYNGPSTEELKNVKEHYKSFYYQYTDPEINMSGTDVGFLCQCDGSGRDCKGCSEWPKFHMIRKCWAAQESGNKKERYYGYRQCYLCKFCRQSFEKGEQKAKSRSSRWVPSGDLSGSGSGSGSITKEEVQKLIDENVRNVKEMEDKCEERMRDIESRAAWVEARVTDLETNWGAIMTLTQQTPPPPGIMQ